MFHGESAAAGTSSGGDPSSSSSGGLHHQAPKLLLNTSNSVAGEHYSPARMSPDDCSEEDVTVLQHGANPVQSGIPTYVVKITNICGACRVRDVHIACGQFASTQIVDPAVFQRVSVNDCLVKGGAALEPGETVSFLYSNSFSYPLNVASVSCA
jgi:hypothetical protein